MKCIKNILLLLFVPQINHYQGKYNTKNSKNSVAELVESWSLPFNTSKFKQKLWT
jgi:competence protein ComGC